MTAKLLKFVRIAKVSGYTLANFRKLLSIMMKFSRLKKSHR